MGLLGLVRSHHLTRDPRHLLVLNPVHERREYGSCYAGGDLAELFDAGEWDSGEPGDYDEYDGIFLYLLVDSAAIFVYASEYPAVAVFG